MTGNDSCFVRDLFQKGKTIREIKLTIKMVLICNDVPKFDDTQEAIWDRARRVVFDSTWSDKAPESQQEQFDVGIFQKDKFFDKKLNAMCPALLWLMVQHYQDYYENGLQESKEIIDDTEQLRIANNIFIAFLKESISFVVDAAGLPDNSVAVTLSELFSEFRRWFQTKEYGFKIPNQEEFKENVQRVLNKNMNADKKWLGIRLNIAPASLPMFSFPR